MDLVCIYVRDVSSSIGFGCGAERRHEKEDGSLCKQGRQLSELPCTNPQRLVASSQGLS